MAPAAVHNGTAAELTEERAITLDVALTAHPMRFTGVTANPVHVPPTAAWIDLPKKQTAPDQLHQVFQSR
jgi:hypothetical protein